MTATLINTVPNTMHKYAISRGDLLRVQLHVLVRNRLLIGFLLICNALVAFSDLRQPNVAALPLVVKGLYVFSNVIMLFAIVSVVCVVMLALLLATRKHRGVLGEHTLEITDNGLVER